MDKPLGEVLAERVHYWQEILGLRDWNVGLSLARRGGIEGGEDALASTNVYPHGRDAIITIVHPMDLPLFKGLTAYDYNYDITLVHELLHLHFQPFQAVAGTYEYTAQEQAIEAVSRALVKLDQKTSPGGLVVSPAQPTPGKATEGCEHDEVETMLSQPPQTLHAGFYW